MFQIMGGNTKVKSHYYHKPIPKYIHDWLSYINWSKEHHAQYLAEIETPIKYQFENIRLIGYDPIFDSQIENILSGGVNSPFCFVSSSRLILKNYLENKVDDFNIIIGDQLYPEEKQNVVIGIITGAFSSENSGSDVYFVHSFSIHIDYQGAGIGSTVLEEFIEKSRLKYGLDKIGINTKSPKAIKLYEKLGFKPIDDYIEVFDEAKITFNPDYRESSANVKSHCQSINGDDVHLIKSF